MVVRTTARKSRPSHSMILNHVEYTPLDIIRGVNAIVIQRTSIRTSRPPMGVMARITAKAAQTMKTNQMTKVIQITKTATIPKATTTLMMIIVNTIIVRKMKLRSFNYRVRKTKLGSFYSPISLSL